MQLEYLTKEELDRRIGVEVMNWELIEDNGVDRFKKENGEMIEETWEPSEYLVYAFEVMKKMSERGVGIYPVNVGDVWEVTAFTEKGSEITWMSDEELPVAICLVALDCVN